MTRLFDLVITRSCPSGQGLTCRRAVCGGTADAVRCWPVAQDHGRIAAISPNPTLLQAPGLVCVGFRSTVFMKDSATQLRFKCLKAFNVCCDWYSVIVGLLTRFQVKLDRFFFFFLLRLWSWDTGRKSRGLLGEAEWTLLHSSAQSCFSFTRK